MIVELLRTDMVASDSLPLVSNNKFYFLMIRLYQVGKSTCRIHDNLVFFLSFQISNGIKTSRKIEGIVRGE